MILSKAWICCCFDNEGETSSKKSYEPNLPFFADSYENAKELVYDRNHNFKYNNIVFKRYPSLDYLNHRNGYVMKWSKEEDRVALQKVGFTCINYDDKQGLSKKCSSCVLYDKCYDDYINQEG